MKSIEEYAQVIQRSWRRRRNYVHAMMYIVKRLYDRNQCAWKAFDLVDVWLDDTIDDAIQMYDRRATRLSMLSFEDYQVLRMVPD